VSSISRSN